MQWSVAGGQKRGVVRGEKRGRIETPPFSPLT